MTISSSNCVCVCGPLCSSFLAPAVSVLVFAFETKSVAISVEEWILGAVRWSSQWHRPSLGRMSAHVIVEYCRSSAPELSSCSPSSTLRRPGRVAVGQRVQPQSCTEQAKEQAQWKLAAVTCVAPSDKTFAIASRLESTPHQAWLTALTGYSNGTSIVDPA